jgi:flavin reductase (DIM6/NTAB) family NADH-FMN oxidoreductase RutF
MIATWIMPASLRKDELRFSFALSKFNDSANAILNTGNFILHELPKSSYKLASKFGGHHSLTSNKFDGVPFTIHHSGIRLLEDVQAYAFSQVISKLETNDRYLLYCKSDEFKIFGDKDSLTQESLFEQIDFPDKQVLSSKYISDTLRDQNS